MSESPGITKPGMCRLENSHGTKMVKSLKKSGQDDEGGYKEEGFYQLRRYASVGPLQNTDAK